MTLPLIDSQQREAFLEVAESLGYVRREFGFVVRSLVRVGQGGMDHSLALHISRGDLRREYDHGGSEVRWLGHALKDLYSGVFGAPDGSTTWLMAFLISDGKFKGKWVIDAYFTLKDGTRVAFDDTRLHDSEADALKAGSNWLRNHMRINRNKLAE